MSTPEPVIRYVDDQTDVRIFREKDLETLPGRLELTLEIIYANGRPTYRGEYRILATHPRFTEYIQQTLLENDCQIDMAKLVRRDLQELMNQEAQNVPPSPPSDRRN